MTAPYADVDIAEPERGAFWYEVTINEGKENQRVELKIDYRRFVAFLEGEGFGLLITDKQVQIVRVRDNIVSDTMEKGSMNITVKRFVLDWLKQHKRDDVEELMLKRHSTFFCTAFLTSLTPLNLVFYRDSPTSSAIFFRNGYLQVSRKGKQVSVEFRPYSQLPMAIWDTYIIDRDYVGRHHPLPILPQDDDDPAEIRTFLELCSTEYKECAPVNGHRATQWLRHKDGSLRTNLKAFMYALGYACHSYKNPANARGIVCVDDDAKDYTVANGGRGKTIFAKIIGYIRRMVEEDGRTLKTDNNQFVLQSVELDSQVVLIDDVKSRFDFGILYNSITGVFALERKREQRILLPLSDSPKVIVTTNYAPLGDGDSDTRRWLIMPFVNYFSAAYTPKDEFGHTLFDDWDNAEWMRFYDFVVDCLTLYFQAEKPVMADTAKFESSKLQASLPDEVLTFLGLRLEEVSEDGFTDYYEFMFEEFKWHYPIFDKKCTRNKFTRYLKTYCRSKGIRVSGLDVDERQWRTVPNAETKTDQKVQMLVFTKEK